MRFDLMSMLRDVAVDPQADPTHVYATVHAGGVPVVLPIQVPHGLPQTLADVIVAASPSIQAGHLNAQSLGIGLLTVYLQHQAQAQPVTTRSVATTPTASAPVAPVQAGPSSAIEAPMSDPGGSGGPLR